MTQMDLLMERLKQAEEQKEKAKKANVVAKWATDLDKYIERMKRTITNIINNLLID